MECFMERHGDYSGGGTTDTTPIATLHIIL